MEFILQREILTDFSTIGILQLDKLAWYTLEDAVREEKIAGETAIPAGRYRIIPAYSPSMKKILPLLLDVPNFTGIFIHPGNTNVDTKGCLLPGKTRGADIVWNSVDACGEIFSQLCPAWTRGEEVWIEIKDKVNDH